MIDDESICECNSFFMLISDSSIVAASPSSQSKFFVMNELLSLLNSDLIAVKKNRFNGCREYSKQSIQYIKLASIVLHLCHRIIFQKLHWEAFI